MLRKHLLVFLIFLVSVLGCASIETVESTKVSPADIYQSYIIRSSKNSTNVNVTFRVNGSTGSTIDLDNPAKIEHNGKEMTESRPNFMKGTDYNYSVNQFIPNHKFTFTDSSGKVWQNEISLQGVEITSQNVNISRTNGATITLSRPVGKDENIKFYLDSEKTPPSTPSNSNTKNKVPEKDYSVKLDVSFDVARTTVKIEPSALKNFVDGGSKIHLTLEQDKTAQQSAKGGSLKFSYQSQNVTANVIN